MKEIARNYVWWPQIDQMIEEKVKTCKSCQQQRNAPPPAPLHPWIWPSKPWSRVHIDYAGPIQGRMLFILVEAHSKWPEVYITKATTSKSTIKCLKDAFSRWGLPDCIVSDNGPQFRSEEFANFTRRNGVKQIFTAPYHPSSNGQVERFVQTVKHAINHDNHKSLPDCLANFLLMYRNTSHPTTQCSPSSLMLRRNLQTRLDLLRPDPRRNVEYHQSRQMNIQAPTRPMPSLSVGDPVLSRSYSSQSKWVPARIHQHHGPLSYTVSTNNGALARRHWDQILPSTPSRPPLPTEPSSATPSVPTPNPPPVNVPSPSPPDRRYPVRARRPVTRFNISAFGGRSVMYD